MCHASLVLERMLDQLKRCPKGKDAFNGSGRSNFHLFVSCLSDIAPGGQTAKAVRHMDESVICLQKSAGSRIDKCDTRRHVGENFFVEDNLTLETACRFSLATIELAAEPSEYGGERDQPRGKHGHSTKKIVDGLVGDGSGLLDYCYPTGRLHGTKRIKVAVPLDVPGLIVFPNLFNQALTRG